MTGKNPREEPVASFDFTGAHVVVIGASRVAIGASSARAFQDAGAQVEKITGL